MDDSIELPYDPYIDHQTIPDVMTISDPSDVYLEYPLTAFIAGLGYHIAYPPTCADIGMYAITLNEQADSDDFGYIIEHLQNGTTLTTVAQREKLERVAPHYIIENDTLWHYIRLIRSKEHEAYEPVRALAVPDKYRLDILEAYHDSLTGGGHRGLDKTYGQLKLKYYWPQMYTDVQNVIRHCDTCQRIKTRIKPKVAPLCPLPVADLLSTWHTDILELGKSKEGYRYVLLCKESFSGFPEAFPMRMQTAQEVAKLIHDQIICRWGVPSTLISDRGTNYMSAVMKDLCDRYDIKFYHTSGFHPQSNAVCERMNSFISQTLRAYCADNQANWPEYLQSVMFAYRASPNTTSTTVSPFQLMTGQTMRLPIDSLLIPSDQQTINMDTGAVRERSLEVMRAVARENKLRSQEVYKAHYDKKAAWPAYELGDEVLLYSSASPIGHPRKLVIKCSGPYKITRVAPCNTYAITDVATNKKHPHLVHANRLKPYKNPDDSVPPTKYPESSHSDTLHTPGRSTVSRETCVEPLSTCDVAMSTEHESLRGINNRTQPQSGDDSGSPVKADTLPGHGDPTRPLPTATGKVGKTPVVRQAGSAARRMLQRTEAGLQGTQAASRKGAGPGAQEWSRGQTDTPNPSDGDEYDILLNPPPDYDPSNLTF